MPMARMAAPPMPPYVRHRPEETLLYQLIETHYPEFRAHIEAQGQTLPAFVQQEFDDFLKCGRLGNCSCVALPPASIQSYQIARGAAGSDSSVPALNYHCDWINDLLQ